VSGVMARSSYLIPAVLVAGGPFSKKSLCLEPYGLLIPPHKRLSVWGAEKYFSSMCKRVGDIGRTVPEKTNQRNCYARSLSGTMATI
jgi:hypothetical protein